MQNSLLAFKATIYVIIYIKLIIAVSLTDMFHSKEWQFSFCFLATGKNWTKMLTLQSGLQWKMSWR